MLVFSKMLHKAGIPICLEVQKVSFLVCKQILSFLHFLRVSAALQNTPDSTQLHFVSRRLFFWNLCKLSFFYRSIRNLRSLCFFAGKELSKFAQRHKSQYFDVTFVAHSWAICNVKILKLTLCAKNTNPYIRRHHFWATTFFAYIRLNCYYTSLVAEQALSLYFFKTENGGAEVFFGKLQYKLELRLSQDENNQKRFCMFRKIH